MEFSTGPNGREDEIIRLFETTFTASEGTREGALIGHLVRRLLCGTAPQDTFVFTAEEGGQIVGGIVFSRLRYALDDRTVFILSPVAVAPARQGTGVGQKLLAHGLDSLRMAGVDIVMTYGDPNFYAKVGFVPVSVSDAPAPHRLNHPEGWLWQSLTGHPPPPLKGPSRCVEALDDPVFW